MFGDSDVDTRTSRSVITANARLSGEKKTTTTTTKARNGTDVPPDDGQKERRPNHFSQHHPDRSDGNRVEKQQFIFQTILL